MAHHPPAVGAPTQTRNRGGARKTNRTSQSENKDGEKQKTARNIQPETTARNGTNTLTGGGRSSDLLSGDRKVAGSIPGLHPLLAKC